MQDPTPLFMTCRRSARGNGDGLHRMEKGFLSMMILRCLMKKIEVSYYEQKTFWSLCSYMVRSRRGIEMLVNLINISYCAMKLLPYQDEAFFKYQTESVQEFRFALSEQIRQQVFYAIFVEKVETSIKSNVLINALKQLIKKQGYHL